MRAYSDVAQVSNLLCHRFPNRRAVGGPDALAWPAAGGLETRDTAGWKLALRFNGTELPVSVAYPID